MGFLLVSSGPIQAISTPRLVCALNVEPHELTLLSQDGYLAIELTKETRANSHNMGCA